MNATSFPPAGPPPRLTALPAGSAPTLRRRWWLHLTLVTAYILLIGVMGREHHEAHTGVPALSHTAGGLLVACGFELLIFAAVLGLALMASRASTDELLWRWRQGFWPVPLGIGYSIAIRFALLMITMVTVVVLMVTHVATVQSLQRFMAAKGPSPEAIVDISSMRQDPLYFWLTLTVVSFIVAGLREELWRSAFLAGLRALWPRRFGSRAGQVAAVVIAAILFGFGHLGLGLVNVLAAGLLGLGLGLIMVFHRAIWPAVIAHGMFDATSLALLPWAAEKLPEIQRTLGH
ncbi:MAG TPA: CPBP family intramembrane glutamic endopeptidase [Candidatus Sulfopaludibacter sp.]|nr:CPBP family intramembrane glutamic endopeptidase [Candidatus Sulfopaludibacter sp.]